jgi:hypothetical protein
MNLSALNPKLKKPDQTLKHFLPGGRTIKTIILERRQIGGHELIEVSHRFAIRQAEQLALAELSELLYRLVLKAKGHGMTQVRINCRVSSSPVRFGL